MNPPGKSHGGVCIVGSGTRFLSGISYYTHRLASELASNERVCLILMRRLLPPRLYPGRRRVGATLTRFDYPSSVIPHGPYDQDRSTVCDRGGRVRSADGICNLLYFGVIRPFKGVEDLVAAFDLLSAEEATRFHLTVVGETWESWVLPAKMIERSRYRERISFVNRYVTDDEAAEFFAAADVVVLPYHRSSSSGPLNLAMGLGLPVIVTSVGGLVEGVGSYEGAIQVPPHRPDAIRNALLRAPALVGRKFEPPHTWGDTVRRYDVLFRSVDVAMLEHRRAEVNA
jgi:glycosyltransferase involved in cell wall biosynthesis